MGPATPKATQPILQMMGRLRSRNLRHASVSVSVGYSSRAVADNATHDATTGTSKRCSESFRIASLTWLPTLILLLHSHAQCMLQTVRTIGMFAQRRCLATVTGR